MADPSVLAPLTVVVPLCTAALLAASAHWLPRRAPDIVALVAAAAVTAMAAALAVTTQSEPLVYWFGGWHPVRGLAIGIAFVVEPAGATLAALSGLLTVASLVFSWRYFEEVGHLYQALVLALLAGMVGFSLSADLFNIFVWLELMSVAAYALCGYRIQQPGVVQGAVNFALLNSIGTLTMLLGIALVYGRTGALNLAQIGETLRAQPPGGPVIVGFTLVTAGLLVKAGAVPFHFWLADAYTVVPAPVGALFAGVMSDLAFHTLARIYWDGFSEALAFHHHAVRTALLCFAVASVVVGAAMALLEANLKRQLAFATVAGGGAMLAGIALLTPRGLAGSTVLLVTEGMLKAALFLLVGAVIQWLGGSDELLLHGRGRDRRGVVPGVLLACCGMGLALAPPFGPFLGTALIAGFGGLRWLTVVLVCGAAATGAVFLRSAARIFLAWGPRKDPALTSQPTEPDEGEPEPGSRGHEGWGSPGHRAVMLTPPLVLVLLGYGLALLPGVDAWFTHVAHAVTEPRRTAAHVLGGPLPPAPPETAGPSPFAGNWLWALASSGGAVVLAALSLWWQRFAGGLRRALLAPAGALKRLHDGSVGDYALWFTVGLAALGAGWSLTLR
ncbi:complex I subunit 5 family protein [Streptomyces sp. MK5]|uniref:complex I subunit 5 family protein n=1 Tax=Streptomyces sp. MK5 TaxID=3064253 RepID=UPI002742955B|nr:complex I subunit 5 family protein [Streptomyces sp. MK5]